MPPPVTFAFKDHSNVAPARFDVNRNSRVATLVFAGGRGETNRASGFLRIVHVYRSGVGSAVASPPMPRTRKLCSPSSRSSYRNGDVQLTHAPWSSLHSLAHAAHAAPPKDTVQRNVACDWSVGVSMTCPGMRASSVTGEVLPRGRPRAVGRIAVSGAPLGADATALESSAATRAGVSPPLFAANCTLSTVSVSSGLRGSTSTVTSSAPCLARYDRTRVCAMSTPTVRARCASQTSAFAKKSASVVDSRSVTVRPSTHEHEKPDKYRFWLASQGEHVEVRVAIAATARPTFGGDAASASTAYTAYAVSVRMVADASRKKAASPPSGELALSDASYAGLAAAIARTGGVTEPWKTTGRDMFSGTTPSTTSPPPSGGGASAGRIKKYAVAVSDAATATTTLESSAAATNGVSAAKLGGVTSGMVAAFVTPTVAEEGDAVPVAGLAFGSPVCVAKKTSYTASSGRSSTSALDSASALVNTSAPAAYASERVLAFAASTPAKISSGVGSVTAPPLRPFGCCTTTKYAVAARSSAAATVNVFVPLWCVTVGYPDANCACEVTACAPTSAGAAQLASASASARNRSVVPRRIATSHGAIRTEREKASTLLSACTRRTGTPTARASRRGDARAHHELRRRRAATLDRCEASSAVCVCGMVCMRSCQQRVDKFFPRQTFRLVGTVVHIQLSIKINRRRPPVATVARAAVLPLTERAASFARLRACSRPFPGESSSPPPRSSPATPSGLGFAPDAPRIVPAE